MSETIEVVHVTFPGDWQALYVDDELHYQNNEVGAGIILNAVEGETVESVLTEWRKLPKDVRCAPEDYSDLPPNA